MASFGLGMQSWYARGLIFYNLYNVTECSDPSYVGQVCQKSGKSDFGAKRTLQGGSEWPPLALGGNHGMLGVLYFTHSNLHNVTGCPDPPYVDQVCQKSGKSDFGAKRTLQGGSLWPPLALGGNHGMLGVFYFTHSHLHNVTWCPDPPYVDQVCQKSGKSDYGPSRGL